MVFDFFRLMRCLSEWCEACIYQRKRTASIRTDLQEVSETLLIPIDQFLESEKLPDPVYFLTEEHDGPCELYPGQLEKIRSLVISSNSDEFITKHLPLLPGITHLKYDVFPLDADCDEKATEFAPYFRACANSLRSLEIACPFYPEDASVNRVSTGSMKNAVSSLCLLPNLKRISIKTPNVSDNVVLTLNALPNLRFISLIIDLLEDPSIILVTPNVEMFEFIEVIKSTSPRYLSITSMLLVKKVRIASSRFVDLPESSPHLRWLELHRIADLRGDVSYVTVLDLYACQSTSDVIRNRFRHLRELRIVFEDDLPAVNLFVDARHLKVLVVSEARGTTVISSRDSPIEVVDLRNVDFCGTHTTLQAKRIFVSAFRREDIDQLVAILELSILTHIAIHHRQQRQFIWEYLLERTKNSLVLFATDIPLRMPLPNMTNLKYLGLASIEDFEFAVVLKRDNNSNPLEKVGLLRGKYAVHVREVPRLISEFADFVWLPSIHADNQISNFFSSYLEP